MSRSTIFAITRICAKYPNVQKIPVHFTLAPTVSELPKFLFLTLENRSRSRSTIFRRYTIRSQMTKSTKDSHGYMRFHASSHSFRDIPILHFLPSKSRSRSRSTIAAMTSFDVKCQNLQEILTSFYASSYLFRAILIVFVYLQKSRPSSQSTNVATSPFDSKCKNLQRLSHIFVLTLIV